MSDETETRIQLTLSETCSALGLERRLLIEIVEHGIVVPEKAEPDHWLFDANMLNTLQRACRLRHDLELDWSAAALVLELLEQKEQLYRENDRLRRQLLRFIDH